MRWLKGIVCATADTSSAGLICVELENGRKAWAMPPFNVDICDHVLIAWDYTNDCIGTITTKEILAKSETEQEKTEKAMGDVFQSPIDEAVEGDVEDIIDIPSTNLSKGTEEENETLSMVDVFPVPNDDGVDCDSIVELRHDITNF
jgi:hypothetical protein